MRFWLAHRPGNRPFACDLRGSDEPAARHPVQEADLDFPPLAFVPSDIRSTLFLLRPPPSVSRHGWANSILPRTQGVRMERLEPVAGRAAVALPSALAVL